MPWELARHRTISTICRSYGAHDPFWIPTAIKIRLLRSRVLVLRNRRLPGPRQRGPSTQANDLYGSNVTLTDVTPEMTMSIPFW
jgi:hypothetical protein